MSGVIDEHGQWEHCHGCGEFVLIQHLLYEQPTTAHPYGRDLCKVCAKSHNTVKPSIVVIKL